MIDFNEIIADLAAEARKGADMDAAMIDAAEFYGAKLEVVKARFARAFPEGVPAEKPRADKLAEAVADACKRYGIPADACIPMVLANGQKVTVICRIATSKIIAVRHDNFQRWTYDMRMMSAAAIHYSPEMQARFA
jgi:hypothetical protein